MPGVWTSACNHGCCRVIISNDALLNRVSMRTAAALAGRTISDGGDGDGDGLGGAARSGLSPGNGDGRAAVSSICAQPQSALLDWVGNTWQDSLAACLQVTSVVQWLVLTLCMWTNAQPAASTAASTSTIRPCACLEVHLHLVWCPGLMHSCSCKP